MTDMNPPQPDITRTIEEILESYAKYLYQLYVDNDGTIQLNRREAVHKLVTLVQEARIDELKKMWGHAREHTITDIEMVMHHSGNTIDFIEGVDARHFENRIKELKEQAND